jgi:hypothetical protein
MAISEDVSFGGGLSVDRKAGIIRSVKVLGHTSQNGRQYTPEAIRQAASLYEGVMVNIDHPDGEPTDQRSAYDRFGKLVRVRYVEGKGLFADLEYLKTHPMAARVCEAAESMPEAFGMSHNAEGEGEKNKDGVFVVSKITEVRHVDLVADPATTKSLSEGVSPMSSRSIRTKKAHRMSEADKADDKEKEMEADMDKKDMEEADYEQDGELMDAIKPSILAVISGDGTDDEKADAILAIYAAADAEDDDKDAMEAKDEETAEEADDDEDKKDDKKSKLESRHRRSLSGQIAQLRSELNRSKREAATRELCESVSLPADKVLVSDLMAMPAEVAARHAKRLAMANKAMRPRSAGYLTEAVKATKPSGLELGRFLAN